MIRIHNPKKHSDEANVEGEVRATRLVTEDVSAPISDAVDNKRPEVLSAAYRILQSGANSRKMLREKLMKKGFSSDEAENAVAICEEQGFIQEKRLLLSHAEYLAKKKHFGKRRIRLELSRKFDRESVDAFFDEAIEEIDFVALAKSEAEKGAKRGKRYVVSRLSTLGFSSHEIYKVVEYISFEEDDE